MISVGNAGAKDEKVVTLRPKLITMNSYSTNIVDSIKVESSGAYNRAIHYGEFTWRGSTLFDVGLQIEYKNKYLRFTPVQGNAVAGTKDSGAVIYRDAWDGVDVYIEPRANGLKETYVIKSASARDTLSWRIDTDATWKKVKNQLSINNIGIVSEPTAYDNDGNYIPITVGIVKKAGNVYYGLTWKKPDSLAAIVYPIFIDPTIIIKPDANTGKDDGGRNDQATTNQGNTADLYIEGSSAGLEAVMFIQINLDTIPANQVISSVVCSLYVDLAQATGGEDYRAVLVTGTWTEGVGNIPPTPADTVTFNNQPATDTTSYFYFERLDAVGWMVLSADSSATINDTLKSWVQGWLDGTITNNGIKLLSQAVTGTRNYNRISSSDHATVAQHPSFTITYAPRDDSLGIYFGDTTAVDVVIDSLSGTYDNNGTTYAAIYHNTYGKWLTQNATTGNLIPSSDTASYYSRASWAGKKIPLRSNTDNYFLTTARVGTAAEMGGPGYDTTIQHQQVGTVSSGLSLMNGADSLFFVMRDSNFNPIMLPVDSLLNYDYTDAEYYIACQYAFRGDENIWRRQREFLGDRSHNC